MYKIFYEVGDDSPEDNMMDLNSLLEQAKKDLTEHVNSELRRFALELECKKDEGNLS